MENHLTVLRMQARELPEAPGVYFWRDQAEKILYIGKAVNLRARVTSYFSNARRDGRTRKLLSQARSVTCEVTASELEALFRESALIKQEQPRFNRALKTPRKLFYLKFDGSMRDPYMEAVREVEDDGSLYFGPFRSASIMRETMAFLHEILPLRKCIALNPRCKPCIYNHMGTCAAPLLNEERRRQHDEAISRLFELLDGRSDRVAGWLEQKRDRLSDALLFERAAEMQHRLDALRELMGRQTILDAAVQCRCIVIRHMQGETEGPRLLLVAHGSVVSIRPCRDAQVDDVVKWVRAHEPVIRAAKLQQSELDAATVLERWLTVNRERVRWVAVPESVDEHDLADRVSYLIGADGI